MYSQDIGGIAWIDLTTPYASQTKDFYKSVVGLKDEPVSMGDYDDYVLKSPTSPDNAVGICHAKGPNTDLPSQWLIYFNVKKIDTAIKNTIDQGGKIIRDKSDLGDYYIAVIEDPAGAVAGLIQSK